ncbi:glycosyltransferase involved in cell wall biosynthesis [Fusobacterium sp. PH5-7]|uniref:glycosyltransferase n=1 Tax=Fusobacterium sp. PH5-7 TaxID=2940528 RepID=UPI00247600CE|nr:glycosyltransferase [Fusobacterium sp. PH5-7]MDH6456561.1 glycosyltransferase involved in cell wall biosynthesis [Fusobacterium sp. PH5-7]
MEKIKVGLLVEEFYDKDLGGYGGYGILAREYIAKYLVSEEIEIEVIIGSNSKKKSKTIIRDGIKIHYLPKNYSSKFDIDFIYLSKVKKFFKEQKFDIYMSIEMSKIAYEVLKREKNKKLILWVQDPRPKYDWEEIKSVSISNEYNSYLNYYSKWEERIQKLLKKLNIENRLILISQGEYLKKKAKDLYKLPENIEIKYFSNPIKIQNRVNFDLKKDSVIFLGRLTPVKRPWIYFELAKLFPEKIFYVCGQGDEISEILEKYKNIKNLKFMGHIFGEEKDKLLKEAKVLVNTSIHEAIPVSFLEAISYGLKILSCQNPDDITANNGYFTGTVLGDGYEEIEKFQKGLKYCFDNYNESEILESIKKIRENHNLEKFINEGRKIIKNGVRNE